MIDASYDSSVLAVALIGALLAARARAVRPDAEASAQQPAAGGRGGRGGAQPAVPVTVAPVVAEGDAARHPRHRHGRGVLDRRGPRADHRRADVGQLQGRRRREEGPGALHARSPAARGGAAAGAGEPRSATWRRPPTREAQATRYQDLLRARHRDARTGRSDRRRNAAALDATVGADRAAVENAKVQLQYATITAPISGRTGALHGARGQPRARQRHDAARRHQPDRADLRVVRHSRGAAARPEALHGGGHAARRGAAAERHRARRRPDASRFVDNAVDPTTGTIKIKGTFPERRPPAVARPVRQRRRHADDRSERDRRARRPRCRPASRASTSSSSSPTRRSSCAPSRSRARSGDETVIKSGLKPARPSSPTASCGWCPAAGSASRPASAAKVTP